MAQQHIAPRSIALHWSPGNWLRGSNREPHNRVVYFTTKTVGITQLLSNSSRRLLCSHFSLNISDAQILNWLLAGGGISALNLWVFQHSSLSGDSSMSVDLYCCCACLFCWCLKEWGKVLLANAFSGFVLFCFVFWLCSYLEQWLHTAEFWYAASYNKKVEWLTSGCSLAPRGIRVTLQVYSCDGSDEMYSSLPVIIKIQDALHCSVCVVTYL